MKIDDIIPYQRNQKKHDKKQVDNVAQSIKEYGYVQPIVIDKDNNIIIGHCRVLASKKLKLETVPCVKLENLTPEEVNRLRLLDNKLNESDWDMELLTEDIPLLDFAEYDIDWGIKIDEEQVEVVEDDFSTELPEEPKAKLGDIYKLGNHRLMCGDSTSITDVEKLIDNNHMHLFLSDPPYGVDIVKNNKVGGSKETSFGHVGGGKLVEVNAYIPIKGDDTTETAQQNYNIVSQITDNQIIFGGNYFTDFLPPKSCWVVWDKENTGNFADVELAWTSFNKSAKLYKWLWNGMSRKGERKTEGKTRVHPTQKPVGMIGEILKDFSKENENILDCFGGSGSTLIACEQLNRNCYMIEYEPHYVDVIIARWEKFTGKKAILLDK